MPMLLTAVRTLQPQPALIIRSRVPREEIAATIGLNLGKIVPYALGAGGALAGQPFARYPEYGSGMITIEVGMPLVQPVKGSGEIEAFTLPAGLTAVAVHGGPYDKLPETFAAFEKWIAAQGHACAGPPWEVYVTDPAEHPDTADWRTEIYWPVR
jgi:AraC family transcriptional regulator